ncbi:MAG: hypothetical protein ACLFWI_24705, partial [Coleofasciculus sp.]
VAFNSSVYAQPIESIAKKQSTVTAEKQLAQNQPSTGSMREDETDLPVSTSDWQAYENPMPVGIPSLYVEGDVRLPNPGYSAELVRPVEQNYLDDSLTLVLRIDEPTGNRVYPQVVDSTTVRYEDEFYFGDYENVIIKAEDGTTLETLDIQVVQ